MAPLVALLACTPELPPGAPGRPDIVLISIDSLRADHLSSYGYTRRTSPNLDALAARGLRFEHASAASPWTLPSHLTMLTGLWPTEHRVVEDTLRLPEAIPLVTEQLRAAGYATGGFVSTVYVAGRFGFARGFDTYEDYGVEERNNLTHPVRVYDVLKSARSWGEDLPEGKPAFLFLHLYDVHYPYRPPAPYNALYDYAGGKNDSAYRSYRYYLQHPLPPDKLAHQVAQYDESIRFVDDLLGPFIASWEARRPTTWIVVADHGEELGERGSWGHGHTLFPEVLQVPLLVAGPGITPAVRADEVGTIDIAATLAALAGGTWGGAGRDLRTPIPARRFWLETSRFDTNRVSLRRGEERLELDLAAGVTRHYVADPAERSPSPDAPPDLVAELLAGLGEPWELLGGEVHTAGGLWRGGRLTGHTLPGAGAFGVWPPDATLTLATGEAVEAFTGQEIAGKLLYHGGPTGAAAELGAATRAQLEALGYVQGAPEGAAAPEGAEAGKTP